ncbi:MAG TPA: hypothetical protein V6D10_16885 [Trichocoleus sp.]|jgi:hypothetical protein
MLDELSDEPSTNELLDDYDLQNTLAEPDPNSDLKVDGIPIADLTEPIAITPEVNVEHSTTNIS